MTNSFKVLFEPDTILMPKQLLAYNLQDPSLLLLSEIITENRFKTLAELKQILKNVPQQIIDAYCHNDPKLIKKVNSDFAKVLRNFDAIFDLPIKEELQ